MNDLSCSTPYSPPPRKSYTGKLKNRVDRTVGPLGERALPNGRDMPALARVARDVASVANVEMLPVLPMPNWKLATLNLKIAVEQYPSCFFCRKERKEHKGGMFLLIIHAVRSVRRFTRLVKTQNRG